MKQPKADYISHVYTPLSEVQCELSKRRKDKKLMKKVSDFFGTMMLDALGDKPRAVLSRSIATPNMELSYFLNLAGPVGLTPLILEYPDKFVAKNPDKYHLCKLFFFRKIEGRNPILVDTLKIVDFNQNEGKYLRDINTKSGENIVKFHHRLLSSEFPSLSDKVIDFSQWFDNTKVLSKYYYLYYLSLFICNGVLFENFLFEDKEESSFIRKKFLPSFKEAENIFGVKPLIYSLLPIRYVSNFHWHSYPEALKEKISGSRHKHQSFSLTRPRLALEQKFEIHDTGKYGLGVFALEKIRKGTVIWILDGEIISFDESIRRIKSGEEEQTDSLQVGLELDMDLDELSRTFNHSCCPNSGLRKTSELIALRDINVGEEITYDYSATIGPNIPSSLWGMRCKCGSEKCRKVLKNINSIPSQQLKKYWLAGALQDYIITELNIIQRLGGKLPKYRKIVL